MSKKKDLKKKIKNKSNSIPDNALPQNILPVGERVEENKNIYISQKVYKEIHKFTQNKTTNESGGMLIGHTVEEFGKTNILVVGFVEAKYCDATPTTLKFTHDTWDYVHKEIDKRFKGEKIVGWIHTHPDFGIFLSDYDKFIHENFFNDENQIAYVIDPIRDEEGFYFWINSRLERCKGFYIYEKAGMSISVETENNDGVEHVKNSRQKDSSFKNVIIGLLCAAVAVLIVVTGCLVLVTNSLNNRIDMLESELDNVVSSCSQYFPAHGQNQMIMSGEIDAIKDVVMPEPEDTGSVETPENPENNPESGEASGDNQEDDNGESVTDDGTISDGDQSVSNEEETDSAESDEAPAENEAQ